MKTTTTITTLALAATALHAQEADLAQKLANPISDLISLPIQSNLDFGVGPGRRHHLAHEHPTGHPF